LTPAAAQDEIVVSAGAVSPPGKPLSRFDISWIDPELAVYFLADRSNAAIEDVPLIRNPPVFQIIPAAPNGFAGVAAGGNDFSGPNGVITFNDTLQPNGRQLWAGDGPTANPVCGGFNGGTCSTVKVITAGGAVSAIATFGTARADELCWAPPQVSVIGGVPTQLPGVVLIANDADMPPFDSFIPTDSANGAIPNAVSQRFQLAGATGGIEQCQFDNTVNFTGIAGAFYQAIPVNGAGPDGAVLLWVRAPIAGAPWFLGAVFNVPAANCVAPQGLAIGPRGVPAVNVDLGDRQILLGCNGSTTTVTVNKFGPSAVINTYANVGGSDQVSFTEEAAAGDRGHFWTTSTTAAFPAQTINQIDPLQFVGVPPGNNPVDAIIAIGIGGNSGLTAHSLASWAGAPMGLSLLEAVVIPIPAGGTSTIPFISNVCGNNAARGCIAFGVISPLPPLTGMGGEATPGG
jgi:hypothetical protein